MSNGGDLPPGAHARRQQEEVHGEEWAPYDAALVPSRANFVVVTDPVGCAGRRVAASASASSVAPRPRPSRSKPVLRDAVRFWRLHFWYLTAIAALLWLPVGGPRAHRRRARRRDRHRPPPRRRHRGQRLHRARVRAAGGRDPRRGLGEDRRQRPARSRAPVARGCSSPPCRGDRSSSAPSSTRSAWASGSSSSSSRGS